uniref:Uncharacterized protein n=1 Tax=Timema bartmani TaxID=61472 RepID=A0A7R9EW08_9NEOP|nr:unnamed protein product [Timema bartmani]
MSGKTYLCLFLVVCFGKVHSAPSGLDVISQLSESLILAERKFAEEVLTPLRNKLFGAKPIVTILDDVTGDEDPNIKVVLTNVRFLTRKLPQIISIQPNFAFLNLAVDAKVGTLMIQGSFNASSLRPKSGISGNITMTFENVTGVGFADLTLINDTLSVTDANLVYKLVGGTVDVTYSNVVNRSSLSRSVEELFRGNVKSSVTHELNQQVKKELNGILKNISSLQVFGPTTILSDFKRYARRQDGNVNTFVDSLLPKVVPLLPYTVTLPNINSSFSRKILFIPIYGHFLAYNGSLENFRTLRRTSDVFLNITVNGIHISGGLGLQTLNFAYDYEAKFWGIGPTGTLKGTVNNNSLNFVVKVTYDGFTNCTVDLESLELKEFEGLKVDVTGLGILNWLASNMAIVPLILVTLLTCQMVKAEDIPCTSNNVDVAPASAMNPFQVLSIDEELKAGARNAEQVLRNKMDRHLLSSNYKESINTPLNDISFKFNNIATIKMSHLQLKVGIRPDNLLVVPDLRLLNIRFQFYRYKVVITGNYKIYNSGDMFENLSASSKGSINVTNYGVQGSGVAGLLLVGDSFVVHDSTIDSLLIDDMVIEKSYKHFNGLVIYDRFQNEAFESYLKEVIHDESSRRIKYHVNGLLNESLSAIKVNTLFWSQHVANSYHNYSWFVVPYFNKILDDILGHLNHMIYTKGFDTYHVPDINQTFIRKESILKLTGSFKAQNGTFRNASTLYRTTDSILAGNGSLFQLSSGIGFREFNVTYNHYLAKFEGVKSSGKISAHIRNTSLILKLSLRVVGEECYPSLDKAHMNSGKKKGTNPNPRASASPLSALFFGWILGVFRLGFQRDLEEEDLFVPLKEHESAHLGNKFERIWDDECRRAHFKLKDPSLVRAIIRCFGAKFMMYGALLALVEILLRLNQPIFLGYLIRYFTQQNMSEEEINNFVPPKPVFLGQLVEYLIPSNGQITKLEAYFHACGVIGGSAINILFIHPYMMGIFHLSMKIRVACCSLVYRKSLKISLAALGDTTVGQVVNLLSNDVNRFDMAIVFLHYLWIGPLEILIITYLLWNDMRWSAIFGAIIMLLFIPMQGRGRKKVGESVPATLVAVEQKDVSAIEHGCGAVQAVEKVGDTACANAEERDKGRLKSEVQHGVVLRTMFSSVENACLGMLTASLRMKTAGRTDERVRQMNEIISGIEVIKMYAWETPFAQLVETARKYVFVVTSFYNILRQTMTVFFPQGVAQFAEVSVSVQRLETFLLAEETRVKRPTSVNVNLIHLNAMKGLSIFNASATWVNNLAEPTLKEISLSVEPNKLIAVIGPVGAGKTSLLHMMLGELPVTSGYISVNGLMSFASQEPWLFAGSVRQNILFGQQFDRERYFEVVKVCSLQRDFTLLPYGDKTIVGDKGISLSGGQRARINLARACYKDADIYLLDDPLSAVDAHVGTELFELCIKGYLRPKGCVLITHQIQYLKLVDNIIIMNNGRIEGRGTYHELHESGLNFAKILEESRNEETVKDEKDMHPLEPIIRRISFSSTLHTSPSELPTADPVEVTEMRTMGKVSGDVFLSYFKSGAKGCVIAFMFFMCILAQFFASSCDMWITQWRNQEIRIVGKPLDRAIKASSYFFCFPLLAYIWLDCGNDHHRLRWGASEPRSPVFSHLGASLRGLTTIRAFGAQEILEKEFDCHQDLHSSAWFLFIASSRTFGFWLDIVCLIYISIVTLSFLVFDNMAFGGNVGLAITQCIGLTGMFQWGMRQSAEVENQMTSVERVLEYTKVEHEPAFDSTEGGTGAGKSSMIAAMFRLAELDGQIVIDGIDTCSIGLHDLRLKLSIIPQEPVLFSGTMRGNLDPFNNFQDVVLWQALEEIVDKNLRFVKVRRLLEEAETAGSTLHSTSPPTYTHINKTYQHRLRLHLFYSQATILKTKDLRLERRNSSPVPCVVPVQSRSLWNLPFLVYVEMKDVVKNLVGGLNSKMCEGGSNFSVGQRQLVCLARAIVRNNKILVLDEATANVDPQTDNLIQSTIRRNFSNCTVLTIAHRLNTVMDSDRVMVMDAGTMVEFDHPFLLLKNKNGFLFRMVQQTGSSMRSLLRTAEQVSQVKEFHG